MSSAYKMELKSERENKNEKSYVYMKRVKWHRDDGELGKALCSLHSGERRLDEIIMRKKKPQNKPERQ